MLEQGIRRFSKFTHGKGIAMGVSRVFRKAALVSALGLAAGGCGDGSAYSPQRDPVSLSGRAAMLPGEALGRAYAHNDYAHRVPLFDALGNGFAAVEADVFLRGEELLVAHTV